MRAIYPKMIIVLVILIVTLVINFRFQAKPVANDPAPQVVKEKVIIKKVYIRVPVHAPADSVQPDSTIITLPKQPLVNPAPDFRKYHRSRNLHKRGFIS
jgi:hypothetical protein